MAAKTKLSAMLATGALMLAGCSGVQAGGDGAEVSMAPPGGDYQAVSELTPLPDFIPGMGTLYVDPATLPAGPFLAYDREGGLVSTTYMVPLDSLNNQEAFSGLDAAPQSVDHVDMVYNAGHPGVDEPHYHIVLWHVSADEAAGLK
jgi:hypothetical protein